MRRTISAAFITGATAITLQAAALLAVPTQVAAAPAAAQYQSQRTIRPSGGDRALQRIVTRFRTDAETLRRSLNSNRGRQDRYDADIRSAVDDLVTTVETLSERSSRNQVTESDLDDVLGRGSALEDAVSSASSAPAVRNAWAALQRDLEAVATSFGQIWTPNDRSYSNNNAPYADRLSGTYELDASRSDDPRRTLDQTVRRQPRNGGRIRRDFDPRLDPPAAISIERNGNEITLASSDAPRITFDASGRLINERRGTRNTTVRASVTGDRIEVSTNGTSVDDFTATFEPMDNGRSMRLTRQMYSAGLSQPVVIRSIYRRTSDRPDWNVFAGRRGGAVGTSGNNGNYGGVIDDGTMLTAVLDQPVNIRSVRENDRVSLTVHDAPTASLENAVVEGYVSSVPNGSSDTSGFGVVFNRIRLSDGRTADFDGTVETVRGPNGESISFDGERVDNGDQRDTAIQRGAIGAAIGAVVGAIAGGTKGAAIGAVIGGGGGAATVLINGQRQTELPRGTQFTIRSRGNSDWVR